MTNVPSDVDREALRARLRAVVYHRTDIRIRDMIMELLDDALDEALVARFEQAVYIDCDDKE